MSRVPVSARRFVPDTYLLALLSTVGVAALLPAHGSGATIADAGTDIAIALLFFLYGARLSSRAVLDGMRHWRLHSLVLTGTFVMFPLFGLAGQWLTPAVVTPPLYTGLLFLCMLPSTVQSSIAFTSTAGGNVPAAICSASLSNMLGVVAAPVLIGTLVTTGPGGGFSGGSVLALLGQLVLPFALGQVARRWLRSWLEHNAKWVGYYERGSILLVVYVAFSASMTAGVWQRVSGEQLVLLFTVLVTLLALALGTLWISAWMLRFAPADRTAILFCGSVKGLASGLPIANVLFPADKAGLVVLPLMLYHLLQLTTCAALARRWSAPVQHTGEGDPSTELDAVSSLSAGGSPDRER